MKQITKILYLVTGYFFALAGCRFSGSKPGAFRLHPGADKIYNYSLTKTSESYNKYGPPDPSGHFPASNIRDTFKLNFSLQNILPGDSINTYRLTFNDFFKNKKPFKFSINNTGSFKQFILKDPFAIYDSMGYFIRGKQLQVVINQKGVVKKISGMEELIKAIPALNDESHADRIISDYLSVQAVKDLLNRFFSAVPGFRVKEGDKWIRNVTLITKAPVKLSNLYTFEQYNGDTAYVSIQSIISAQQSEGDNPYMKGKGKGIAIVNYATGMPYLYETRSETETITTQKQYSYINREHFLVKKYH